MRLGRKGHITWKTIMWIIFTLILLLGLFAIIRPLLTFNP